jgi:hypothetical protein
MNHTVAINHSFMRAAQEAGMNEEEIERFGRFLSENPTAGEVGAARFGSLGEAKERAAAIGRSPSTQASSCRCS